MGFRTYIGKLSKDNAEKIKKMTTNDIINEFGDEDNISENYPPGPYELAKEVYELGKYVELETESYRLFDNNDVEKHYNGDYTFYGMTKDGFKNIIDMYRKDIAKYYKDLRDSYGVVGVDQEPIIYHLNSMVNEWHNDFTNALDLTDDPELTTSWKYEYAIFEMVRLYKTFDWENDIAVIYGY